MDQTVIVIIAGVVVLLALGVFLFFRSRRAAAARDEPYYHFVCTGCNRKLRYRRRQAGHSGMCPRCSRPCTFPPVGKN
jgi:LPXTG-motif cell wall-anchored protein